ncbi:plastocyanin [Pelomonas saccharophila]|uniref:Plastocyanin n=1 Tax=Roseateles saccharophilus TaxID=304 RepID=A0ABU1YNH3_ROSSA|nr:methylamine utilization protein [Roseateles saccharophilus]MDR7269780.1 plastocyanin [Roseateles saccharophilus]
MTTVRRLCLLAFALSPLAAAAVPVTVQLRGPNGQPLADAAVAVEVKGRTGKTSSAKAEMGQRDRQFTPQLLIVQTGTSVSFPNFDTVRHHVYSFSPIKVIDIKLYSGTPAEPIVFDKPGVATLGCNIHDRMSAHIVVVDTPTFGRTDPKGQLSLDLPAGEHVVKAWHGDQKSPSLQSAKLDVPAGGGPLALTLAE